MTSFEIVDGREDIKQYYPQWEDLFACGNYESSLSVAWTEALLTSHLEGCRPFLIVLRDSTGLAGLVPLYVKEIKKSGATLLTLCPVSEHFNTHSDLLIKEPSNDLAATFLKAVFSLSVKWDVFRMNRFVDGQPLLSSLEAFLRNNSRYKYQIERAEPSLFIQLGSNYDEYLKTVSGKFRYKLKRASRQLYSTGELSFINTYECRDFDNAFESILAIERTSWKHKNGTGISSTEKQRQFYRDLCRREFTEGRWRVWLLYVNHTLSAYEMGLVNHRKYYSVHGSYNEAFRKDNPGTVLLARVIEDLIQDGINELDFFGEPFEWQRYWTDKVRWHRSLLIYNHGLKARGFYVFGQLKDRLRSARKEDELVWRRPRNSG